ncbi:MAG: hypothetical protein MUF54_01510 [Polyangiaceae bacterium]|jgi:hypothetical protein|nr:hypothetical protein [Polyangiaceae bacterium]
MPKRICGPGLCRCDEADTCPECATRKVEAGCDGLCEPCHLATLDARDRTVTYVTFHSAPDEDGRRRFTLEWWAANFHLGPCWRAQVFHADPGVILKGRRWVQTEER